VTKRIYRSILGASSIAIIGLVGMACGGSDDTTITPPPDTGSPSDGGAETIVDSTLPIDTAFDAPFDAPAIPVKALTMMLSQTTTVAGGTTTYATYATARVVDTTATGGGKCTIARMGTCDVVECDLSSLGGDAGIDAGTIRAPNASDIHFNSPTIGDVELHTDKFGLYDVVTGTRKYFVADDVIKTTAAGSDIPAWTDKPGTAPGDVTLTAPACASGACADVDRTADLQATWTGGTTGVVSATYVTTETGKKSVVVSCSFKATDGKGTIPKAALAKLDKADGTTIKGVAMIGPSSTSTFKSGEYDIVLFISGSGGSGTFNVTK